VSVHSTRYETDGEGQVQTDGERERDIERLKLVRKTYVDESMK